MNLETINLDTFLAGNKLAAVLSDIEENCLAGLDEEKDEDKEEK